VLKNSKKMSSITEILKTKPVPVEYNDSITIMAMVRQGKSKDKLEIGIGMTGNWFELPVSQIKNAEEAGVYKLNDELYKVVNLEIAKPKNENIWFDYLAMVIDRLNKMPVPSGCGCNNHGTDPCTGHSSENQGGQMVSYRIGAGTGVRSVKFKERFACWWNGYSLSWCEEHGM
jgi:hypothetical protein